MFWSQAQGRAHWASPMVPFSEDLAMRPDEDAEGKHVPVGAQAVLNDQSG